MNYKIICLIIGTILLNSLFIGCITEEPNNTSNGLSTKGISLDMIYLTEEDLPGNYSQIYEEYNQTPKTQENQTGNGLIWHIQQSYDVVYYDMNSTNGVMLSILELDTQKNAENLTVLSYENQRSFEYNEENIDSIGDTSYLLYKNFNESNTSYTYYLLMFSLDTLFVALGGSAADENVFVDYAKTIEQRIIDTCTP